MASRVVSKAATRSRASKVVQRSYASTIARRCHQGGTSQTNRDSSKDPLLTSPPCHQRDKTTSKVRMVYDAPCSEDGNLSMNQCLQVGSSFNQYIFDLLLRFGIHKVALVGDVEKAFLTVGIAVPVQQSDIILTSY